MMSAHVRDENESVMGLSWWKIYAMHRGRPSVSFGQSLWRIRNITRNPGVNMFRVKNKQWHNFSTKKIFLTPSGQSGTHSLVNRCDKNKLHKPMMSPWSMWIKWNSCGYFVTKQFQIDSDVAPVQIIVMEKCHGSDDIIIVGCDE
jgi:hypothetical protein